MALLVLALLALAGLGAGCIVNGFYEAQWGYELYAGHWRYDRRFFGTMSAMGGSVTLGLGLGFLMQARDQFGGRRRLKFKGRGRKV